MTSNNSASLLLPLERARDSTLCQTKAEKTLVIYHIKYHLVRSLESQALQFQLPACLVDQILQKTTGRIHVITFSKKYCSKDIVYVRSRMFEEHCLRSFENFQRTLFTLAKTNSFVRIV